MRNKIENVVIVAGGLNTRMEDLSVFPKVLFPMPNCSSILTYDTLAFKDKKVYLVINEKYYDMVCEYCKRNMIKLADIIKSSNTDGSANTLNEVSAKLPQENTLLVWSDLIIKDFKMLETLLENTSMSYVILTQAGHYRFRAIDIAEVGGVNIFPTPPANPESAFCVAGNVPGIYFYHQKPEFWKIPFDKHDYDFVEFIRDYYSHCTETCPVGSSLVEFRDKEKFREYYLDSDEIRDTSIPRFFNNISIDKDDLTFTKTCTNPEYAHLIEKEQDWYSKVESEGFTGIPKVICCSRSSDHSESSITMELLVGYMTPSEYAKDHTQEEIKVMVDKIIAKAEELHATTLPVEFVDVQEDYEEEYVNKVLRRCDSIKHMLINYDRDKLERLLTKACNILYHQKCKIGVMPNTTYSLIHGDLNGSNVMYNPETGEVKFIDPRGYFGETLMYGPEEYDFAKILYFISGYDEFNKGRAIYNDWKFEQVLETWNIPDKLMWWNYWIILGIIWIALAQYIGQDIMKANLAYEHGMEILEEELENSENQGHIE